MNFLIFLKKCLQIIFSYEISSLMKGAYFENYLSPYPSSNGAL